MCVCVCVCDLKRHKCHAERERSHQRSRMELCRVIVACILCLGLVGTIDNLGGHVFTLSFVGLAILIAHYRKRATFTSVGMVGTAFWCACMCAHARV